MKKVFVFFIALLLMLCSCKKDSVFNAKIYKTKNVIIITWDGVRYSEGWGDTSHQNTPHLVNEMFDSLTIFTNLRNNGITNTTNGHTAIMTGNYSEMQNNGTEFPPHPSVFHYWLKEKNQPAEKAWLVTAEWKLFVLGSTSDPSWNSAFSPVTDCGLNGGLREDSSTRDKAISVLQQYHPQLMLVHFDDPDFFAHQADSVAYINAIKASDEFTFSIWNYLQSDSFYKNTTTVFITTDHGRHLNNVNMGYISHGDGCDGCRHTQCFALSPDFKKGMISNEYDQTDITATIAELMGIFVPQMEGNVMNEAFMNK